MIRLRILQLIVCSVAVACREGPDLDPARWSAGELERFTAIAQDPSAANLPMTGDTAMVAGIADARAVRAGFETLKQGGSAADAALTTALADVVLSTQAIVSFAGEMTLTYYDASTRTVSTLDATFQTVRGETDPLSIPPLDQPSGRSALVPGFFAGVQAIHERFGRLPFAALFAPAIHFAEHGFVLTERGSALFQARPEALQRLPEGRRIFTKSSGEFYAGGETFKQPEAARTLREISRRGADYVYRGPWAERLVAAVRADGGKMTLEDLTSFRPLWTEPVRGAFRGYEVVGTGLPTYGGVVTIEAMHLAELAGLPQRGDLTGSPEALAQLIRIAQASDVLGPPLAGPAVPDAVLRGYMPDLDLAPAVRSSAAGAARVWAALQRPDWARFRREAERSRGADSTTDKLQRSWGGRRPRRTSGLVAIDPQGNVAVMMHSVNAGLWGSGIFVDGFAIPDAGALLQHVIVAAGPGARIPLLDNPTLVLQNGRPVVASVAVGAAFHETNVQNLIAMLDYHDSPRAAAARPQLRKQWPYGEPLRLPVGEGPGLFSEATIRGVQRLGVEVEMVTRPEDAGPAGAWLGVSIDRATGRIAAALGSPSRGIALGW